MYTKRAVANIFNKEGKILLLRDKFTLEWQPPIFEEGQKGQQNLLNLDNVLSFGISEICNIPIYQTLSASSPIINLSVCKSLDKDYKKGYLDYHYPILSEGSPKYQERFDGYAWIFLRNLPSYKIDTNLFKGFSLSFKALYQANSFLPSVNPVWTNNDTYRQFYIENFEKVI